jgi:hypothetical protein
MLWVITEVSIIIIYPYQRACHDRLDAVFIITCRMGCQRQIVQELSDVFST